VKCNTCGNEQAIRITINARGERCDRCSNLTSLKKAKKGGFMFQGKSLHHNGNLHLAKQVRQEYLGTDHDERRGRDW
jgi:DNA-directed RNA polymerase subunit RPC12/RpoP